jgi:hypothetical protein
VKLNKRLPLWLILYKNSGNTLQLGLLAIKLCFIIKAALSKPLFSSRFQLRKLVDFEADNHSELFKIASQLNHSALK